MPDALIVSSPGSSRKVLSRSTEYRNSSEVCTTPSGARAIAIKTSTYIKNSSLSGRTRACESSDLAAFADFINGWINNQLENEGREYSADHGRSDSAHDVGTRARGPHDRNQAHEHHGDGHDFRPQ